jgi:VIT1/CCC1 family predicted Fe2+/Mn2+ transporter
MNNKGQNNDAAPERESFTELLGKLANSSAAVVRDELELFSQTIRAKAKAVRNGIIIMSVGAVILFAAFLALCAALILRLTYHLAPDIAALVAAAALIIVGVIVALIGLKNLKKSIVSAEQTTLPLQRRKKNG